MSYEMRVLELCEKTKIKDQQTLFKPFLNETKKCLNGITTYYQQNSLLK